MEWYLELLWFGLGSLFGLLAVTLALRLWLRASAAHWTSRGHDLVLVPPPTYGEANSAANERRTRIEDAFRSAEIPLGKPLASHLRTLPRPFLEIPPNLPAELPSREFGRAEALGELVRLQWQLHDDALLLGERLVDALVIFQESAGPGWVPSARSPLPLVRLEYEPLWRLQRRFPWKAVLEIEEEELRKSNVAIQLRELREWLGIGVVAQRPVRVVHFGQCRVGQGRSGSAGGSVSDGETTYGVTCSHVLSAECQSAVVRSDPSVANEPDAALIRRQQPCFELNSHRVPCSVASGEELRAAQLAKRPVRKGGKGRRGVRGFIADRVHAFPLEGVYYRFPHLKLYPLLPKILKLLIPSSFVVFSRPGDSGSWVFDAGSGRWLGMIVGGDSDFLGTYVTEAGPLVDYLEAALAIHQGATGRTLAPFSDGG